MEMSSDPFDFGDSAFVAAATEFTPSQMGALSALMIEEYETMFRNVALRIDEAVEVEVDCRLRELGVEPLTPADGSHARARAAARAEREAARAAEADACEQKVARPRSARYAVRRAAARRAAEVGGEESNVVAGPWDW